MKIKKCVKKKVPLSLLMKGEFIFLGAIVLEEVFLEGGWEIGREGWEGGLLLLVVRLIEEEDLVESKSKLLLFLLWFGSSCPSDATDDLFLKIFPNATFKNEPFFFSSSPFTPITL